MYFGVFVVIGVVNYFKWGDGYVFFKVDIVFFVVVLDVQFELIGQCIYN